MTILGIKLTHDGAVALIDNGTLIFSYEMEKLNNFPRYSNFCIAINDVKDILSEFGYSLSLIDQIVIDGWDSWDPKEINSPEKEKLIGEFKWGGKKVRITTNDIASYGRIIKKSDDILHSRSFEFKEQQFSYKSYLHVSSHVVGAYCTSKFSAKKEDSYILTWDGGTPPQLFYYKYKENVFASLGVLFPLMGYIYINFPFAFKPFSLMTHGLSIAGKAMAYMALGKVRQKILQRYKDIFSNLNEKIKNTQTEIDVVAIITYQFIKEAKEFGTSNGFNDEDMLTTFQEFIQELLIENLVKRIAQGPDNYVNNLCLTGGCALNIKWNSSIRASKIFKDVWIPPFPNDSGCAIGTACCEMLVTDDIRSLDWNVYSGPKIKNDVNEMGIQSYPVNNYSFRACTLNKLADILHKYNEPVVFLNECAELGPRALGNRSILTTAVSLDSKMRLNAMKHREEYRPIAPICLEEYAAEVFTPGSPDSYMLFEHVVKPIWKQKVPAVCHLDDTARLQTVNSTENRHIYELLTAYHSISGIPLLCNTSANFNGMGFFPDLQSAMKWNKANLIWSNGILYIKKDFVHLQELLK